MATTWSTQNTPIPPRKKVLVNLPILLFDVLCIGCPVYFMVGFAPGPRFAAFLAILLALNLAADNFYRLLGAIMPNLHVGVAIGVTILIAMELLAGAALFGGVSVRLSSSKPS